MNKTAEEIKKLNEDQQSGIFHPFTCGCTSNKCLRESSYKKRMAGEVVPYTSENEGVLIATEKEWVCPCGEYKQPYIPAASPQPDAGGEMAEFLKAVTNERNEFAKTYSMLWDAELRTKCDSLLMIYDQMKERLESTSLPDNSITNK